MSNERSADERYKAIAQSAYHLWEERGRPEGSPEEDWHKAELTIDSEPNSHQVNDASLESPALQLQQKAKAASPSAR
jgi:hypothetical protein